MADLTGIIGAMPEEIAALLADLEAAEASSTAAFTLHRGRLDGREVLLARCGIGKVNAAALTQLMISRGIARLLFTGVAGAVDPALAVGDIVVSLDALQHDVDVSGLGYPLGQVPGEDFAWRADPALVERALAAAGEIDGIRATVGRVASGDQFIADPTKVAWLRATFGAACAEMEGAAVAQVCARWGIPFVIVRSVSDTADHAAEMSFREFTPLAAARAKRVVRGILARL